MQNTLTFQNEAFVARGRQDLSECHESSDTIAGESESNLVCHETAHDAPVNTLTKIDAIRRAHGVRVNQRGSHLKDLHQPARPCLKNGSRLSKREPIAKLTLCIKDVFGFALGCLTACVTRWWAGRGNVILTEPTPSHANCLKTRRLPPVGCTLC